MSDLNNSQTKKNIMLAFQGESLAYNRYNAYEEQAKKEGNSEVAAMFAKMAKNEMIHARMWFRLMNVAVSDSASNIKAAAAGEQGEWQSMYPGFAKTAREEGHEDIARMFEQVANIERDHEKTFLKAYIELVSKQTGRKEDVAAAEKEAEYKTVYRCQFCGAVYDRHLDACPVCGAIGSFEQGTAKVE